MAETILSSPLFTDVILPFLLVFTVIFAILQRTKILGEGKRQIDAITALVIGLIVISFGYATDLISLMIPFLAVAAVVILVFMLLYGMVFVNEDFKLHSGIKVTVGILVTIGVIVTVLVATGAWDYLSNQFFMTGDDGSYYVTSVIFLVIIVGAVIAVSIGGKGDKKKSKDE